MEHMSTQHTKPPQRRAIATLTADTVENYLDVLLFSLPLHSPHFLVHSINQALKGPIL